MKYKIINKSKIQNYIKFELDGNVKFREGEQNFVRCVNRYPFINYRIGDEIEVDLNSTKSMSAYDYIEQQEIIRKVSENYTEEHYDEYNQKQGEGESSSNKELGSASTLDLVALSAHNKVLAFENFRYLLESLEEYVEKTGYYPDFRSKRQLRNITIPKEKNYSLDNCKELFRTRLLLFVGVLGNDTPDDTKKEIQEQFYKWINIVGIGANNCPDENLKHFLIEINNVLEGNSEKIIQQTQKYLENEKKQPTSIRDAESALELFNSIQGSINDKEKQAELYKNKNYFEVEFENKFGKGNSQQGEQNFNQLVGSVSSKHEGFDFFLPKNQQGDDMDTDDEFPDPRQSLIRDVEKNPWQWRIEELIISVSHNVLNKEWMLIRYDAEIKSEFGNIQLEPGKLFNKALFSESEWAKIGQVVSQNQGIRQGIINGIRQGGFTLYGIVFEGDNSDYREDWYIHNSVEVKNGVEFDPEKMYKIKDLNETEKEAIVNKSAKSSQSFSSVSIPKTKENNNKLGTSGILAIVGVFSAVVIAGVAVVKNSWIKKLKR